MEDWIERDKESLLPTYNRLPIIPMDGEGCYLIDIYENKYLDLFSGLGVNVLGYNHAEVEGVILEHACRPLHLSNYFYNTKAIELAERIINETFSGKVFYTNSGTEAVEAAIKYIHKYGHHKGKKGIISFSGSFHGRTLGALKLTRLLADSCDFPMMDYPVYQLDMGNIEGFMEVCKNNPAAVIFECISGSGGVHELSVDFIKEVQDICRKQEILLCVDEIQTGMGRTGRVFAYQNYDIKPDLIVFAKGVGGGLPLGGLLVDYRLSGYFKAGDHGTTFGPNYLASALGCKVLDIVSCQNFLAKVREKGDYIKAKFGVLREKYPELVGEVRGRGLMLGIDIYSDCQLVQKELLEKNILVNIAGKNVLRLLPPLVIEHKDIDYFISTLDKILSGIMDYKDKL